jgi:hypothetical protein
MHAGYLERDFPLLASRERIVTGSILFREKLSREFRASATVSYDKDLEARALDVPGQTWQADLKLEYSVLEELLVSGGYVWRETSYDDGRHVPENVLLFSIEQDL